MEVPDRLERRIEVTASPARVWRALTEPDLLLAWFPTHDAHVDLRVGGAMRFVWEDDADEAIIDVVEPPERLVFRWRPEGRDRPYTTVSIFLHETTEGGTEVVLAETGFASLPGDTARQSYEGNRDGWAKELAELQAFLEKERV